MHEYYAEARALPNLDLVGLSTHIGSQITDTAPFTEAGEQGRDHRQGAARERHARSSYLDLGGGLGIPYQEEPPPPSEYAAALLGPLRGLGLKLIIEPGRVLVGNAGIAGDAACFTSRRPTLSASSWSTAR